MIRDDDVQFHPPTADDPLWAETNYFGLYVAGEHIPHPINIGVYGLFREPLGVVGSTVSVNSRRVTLPWAADYWDAWEHLVVPEPHDLANYRLANGLSVVCREPNRVWDVDYSDPAAELELHFTFTGLMDPYDINDPDMDPMAARQDMDKTWGHAYAGHFDLTGGVEGELSLRGQRHAIDCVSTMDHSWGVRAERQTSRLCWLHAHVGRDLAVHGLFDFSTDAGPDSPSPLRLTHGYVLAGGEVRGLSGGGGTTRRSGFYPEHVDLDVTDVTGQRWQLHGEAHTTFPWQAWPGSVGHNALLKWSVDGGEGARTGWGEVMDFIGLGELGAAYNLVHQQVGVRA
ncbi:MAG: DUF7064 domain-containing protein [Janthinobacterium lividum]